MFRDRIREELHTTLRTLAHPEASFVVEVPGETSHGDYATNVAMVLAHTLKKSPMEIAGAIADALKEKTGWGVTVAAPGFINIRLDQAVLIKETNSLLKNPEGWGKSDVGNGKTIMVEYFQPNIAKNLHVGHLRSAVIGDALKRMLLAQGYHVVSDTHLGDWGTQFGILLWAYKSITDKDELKKIEENPFAELDALYVRANARITEDPTLRERGKEEFAKLERGDEENRKIWKWMVEVSMKKIDEHIKRLGLLPFDEHRGESFYEEMMPPIVELALQKGVAKKNDDGAIIVDLTAYGLDDAVMIKSDGASTYLLRDLATIKYRAQHWNFWKNIYVVDNRQSHHFKQVFRVAELLGFEGIGDSQHVELGFMSLPEGPMSTRKGNVIYLEKVINEAIARARKVIADKNPDLEDADEVASAVGMGALKYFDLSHHRRSEVTFSWDEALNFEGNTGPYIQYTNARLQSILRKIDQKSAPLAADAAPDETERLLLATLLRFPEVIEDALSEWAPNILANYLFTLAQRTNEFYHSHPVTQEPDQIKKDFRVRLISAISLTLVRGLDLLGIKAPSKL